MARGRLGLTQDWLWEWDVEGMAVSRFKIGGGINEFETVDFFAGLPVAIRRGDISFKGSLFHSSSHLGDDYIRRTGSAGYRYSVEGVSAQSALEPAPFLRFYGGGIYLLHTVPSPARWSLQSGVELTSPDLRGSARPPIRLFLAEDLQWRERVRWNLDSHFVGGIKFGAREPSARAVRLQGGWYRGHSPYGQFYARRERVFDISVALEL